MVVRGRLCDARAACANQESANAQAHKRQRGRFRKQDLEEFYEAKKKAITNDDVARMAPKDISDRLIRAEARQTFLSAVSGVSISDTASVAPEDDIGAVSKGAIPRNATAKKLMTLPRICSSRIV